MTPTEALDELQNTYDKKLTNFQTSRYLRFLGKFNREDISRIVAQAIEEARYLPKISQLNDAAKDLLILRPKRGVRADPKCEICQGTGWEYVKETCKYSGDLVEAVKRCDCSSLQLVKTPEGEEIPF